MPAFLTTTDPSASLQRLDWKEIATQLDVEGFAVLRGLLLPEQVSNLTYRMNDSSDLRRVPLAFNDLGRGDLFYFSTLLPKPLSTWRAVFYRHLAPIANRWSETLNIGYRYPSSLKSFILRNREAGQTQATSHLNRLREWDYLALHQRNEGEHVFPLQVVALLSAPERDFEGGEFVMTEQRPRMQSRPIVLPLELGDAAIISTAQRPFKGNKGYYRVNLKHAIGRVRRGERIGLEMSFHDTP